MSKQGTHNVGYNLTNEEYERLRAKSDRFREIGTKSDLPSHLLPMGVSDDLRAALGERFVLDFNNAQRGMIESIAADQGLTAEEVALRMKAMLSQPKPTQN